MDARALVVEVERDDWLELVSEATTAVGPLPIFTYGTPRPELLVQCA